MTGPSGAGDDDVPTCYRCGQPGTFYARIGSLGQRRACDRHAKGWPGWTPTERLLHDVFGRPEPPSPKPRPNAQVQP